MLHSIIYPCWRAGSSFPEVISAGEAGGSIPEVISVGEAGGSIPEVIPAREQEAPFQMLSLLER